MEPGTCPALACGTQGRVVTAITAFEEEVELTPLTGVTWSRHREFVRRGWTFTVFTGPPVVKLDGYPRVAP